MTLEFIKLANKWYVDLPNWEGSVEDLELEQLPINYKYGMMQ